MRFFILGAMLLTGSAFSQVPPTDIQFANPVVGVNPLDRADLIRSRQEAINRVRKSILVEQKATSPEQCLSEIASALKNNAFQVFVEGNDGKLRLAPLFDDIGLRQDPDTRRIEPICNSAKKLWVIVRDKNSKEPILDKDLAIAWTSVEWAQIAIDESIYPSLAAVPSQVAIDVFAALPSTSIIALPEKPLPVPLVP